MGIKDLIERIKNKPDFQEIVCHHSIPPKPPSFGATERPLRKEVERVLKAMGIDRLYSHQARGIDLVRKGNNLVVMTPTASGKSLIYNIPVIEAILKDSASRAIYIFPLKGLEQDQLKALRRFEEGISIEGLSAVYDGDTTAYRRKRIRESPPSILITTPDMIHLAINPFHKKWETFFKDLKFIIVDEIHTYRGVFGSHVAQVIRRMRRICNYYGSDPKFIACSATIANPKELAERLIGLPFEVISESGAPSGGRHFLFINPHISPYRMATRLFIMAVRSGFKTIAFTKARKITELIHRWVRDEAPDIEGRVSSYRAGFLPSERRDIEKRLFLGELNGVISTSALELGVDIGGLDVCILVGYPGTIASTWQRSGRVGRHGQEALIVMIALPDALDQYFMRHPEELFKRSSEAAVLDPENPEILKIHLPCAAAEVYLREDDRVYDLRRLKPILKELEKEERVRRGRKGDIWFSRMRYPQRFVGIREIGETFTIVDGRGPIGEVSVSRVFYELYPGAVYLHHGRQYVVIELDTKRRKILCKETDVDYYTQPLSTEEIEIVSPKDTKEVGGMAVSFGTVRVRERVYGYVKRDIYTQQVISKDLLDLPPSSFTTAGVWIKINAKLLEDVDPGGSLHAIEHTMIATLPLFALCDRSDLGGVSYPYNPELASPAIFVYDGHEGGVGLTERGYEVMEGWLATTMRLIRECPCESGCPSCVQDPRCGNLNTPLDKDGALRVMERWMERKA